MKYALKCLTHFTYYVLTKYVAEKKGKGCKWHFIST